MTLMIYIFKQSYYICLFTGMLKHLISYLFVFLAQIYIWDFIKKLGSQLWSWLKKLGVWHTCDVQNRLLAYNIWKNCLYLVAAHLIGLLDSVEYGKSERYFTVSFAFFFCYLHIFCGIIQVIYWCLPWVSLKSER